MTTALIYQFTAVMLMGLGLYAVIVRRHLIRRLMGANIFGTGVFMLFIAMTAGSQGADPVPEAMVLTGLVVAVSATALGLVLIGDLHQETGSTWLRGGALREDQEERWH